MAWFRNRPEAREAVTEQAAKVARNVRGYAEPMVEKGSRLVEDVLARYGWQRQREQQRPVKVVARRMPLVLGLLTALVAGAGAALLLAPRRGAETREIVVDKSKEVFSRGRDLASRSREPIMRAGQAVWQRGRSTGAKVAEETTSRASRVAKRLSGNSARAGGKESGKQ